MSDTAKAAIEAQGLSIKSEFVPWSQSRNKGEKNPSLNWRVTLTKSGRDILTTDYSAGMAHAPSYKQGDNSLMGFETVKAECETGRKNRFVETSPCPLPKSSRIQPNVTDVIYSLVLDSDVLNYGGFEEWSRDFGYDADSRKAEAIYHACLDIALKLRNGLGDNNLETLREAFQDY